MAEMLLLVMCYKIKMVGRLYPSTPLVWAQAVSYPTKKKKKKKGMYVKFEPPVQ